MGRVRPTACRYYTSGPPKRQEALAQPFWGEEEHLKWALHCFKFKLLTKTMPAHVMCDDERTRQKKAEGKRPRPSLGFGIFAPLASTFLLVRQFSLFLHLQFTALASVSVAITVLSLFVATVLLL